jgi:Holliday junction resolvasome RuvABC endonuclease subunit
MSSRVIASFDLATQTGWAVSANGLLTYGTCGFHRFKGSKSRPEAHVGQPFVDFRTWLIEHLSANKPTEICYEEVYRWVGASAAHAYCGYRAILLALAAKQGVKVYPYSPTAIKKHWTGQGNAKKDAMIAESLRRMPELREIYVDDNMCDAIALLSLHVTTKS